MERKHRILQEMAITMMLKNKVNNRFWKEAFHTAIHIQNRCFPIPPKN